MQKLKAEKLRREYDADPTLYIDQVLGQSVTPDQIVICHALRKYKKVIVRASHSIGKTFLGGSLVNWFYDVHNPGITLTTAPTKAQVHDLLWKEVRTQRRRRRLPGSTGLLPKADRMESSPDHFAAGYTASSADAFQGRHEVNLLMIFDEATGIDSEFFDAGEGMMTGDNCYWLCIANPTDTSSRLYQEDQSGEWHTISASAMNHPNIAAELAREPVPFPAAVRLGWLEERIRRWCEPIPSGDKRAGDFEFPPGSGEWYRPGPLFEGRVLGRWPSQGSDSVWSEAKWEAALTWQPIPKAPLQIGCDVARFGTDYTSFVVRRGPCALHHETHNGWGTEVTAGTLKRLAKQFAEPGEDPRMVAIKVDDDGVGGGVVDQANGYNFIGVSAAEAALQPEDYPNRRSELWFAVAGRADNYLLDLSRLSEASLKLLKVQAFAPKWKVDANGCRVVEPKDMMKKRLGRSPDDMDALNLSYAYAQSRVMSSAAGGKKVGGYRPR